MVFFPALPNNTVASTTNSHNNPKNPDKSGKLNTHVKLQRRKIMTAKSGTIKNKSITKHSLKVLRMKKQQGGECEDISYVTEPGIYIKPVSASITKKLSIPASMAKIN